MDEHPASSFPESPLYQGYTSPPVIEPENTAPLPGDSRLQYFWKSCERLGFYAFQILGVFCLGRYWGYSDFETFQLFSATAALMYITPHLKGLIGRHYTGNPNALRLGTLFLLEGYALLFTWDQNLFFVGLGLVILGNGCFKAHQPEDRRQNQYPLLYLGLHLATLLPVLLLDYFEPHALNSVFMAIVAYCSVFSLLFWAAINRRHKIERLRLWACIGLIILSVIFFAFYYQMPTTATLFSDLHVKSSLLGVTITPESYAFVNAWWVILLTPFLTRYYYYLIRRPMTRRVLFEFALGLILTSLSFLVLPFALDFTSDGGTISGNWLLLDYLLWVMGEVLFSALGLILIAQLSPREWMAFAMAIWQLCPSLGWGLSAWIFDLSTLANVPVNLHPTTSAYVHAFGVFGWGILLIALLFAFTTPLLHEISSPKRRKTF